MRKIFVILVCSSLYFVGMAQNVGIGTNSPNYTLDVNGRMRLRHTTDNYTSGLWFNKSNNTEGAFVGMVNDSTVGFWGNAPVGNWKAAIDVKNGLLGVGTTDPTAPLTFNNGLGNKIDFYYNSSQDRYGIGLQGSLLQMYSGSSADDIAFGYGGSNNFSEIMRIKGDGRVSIGVSSPANRLSVSGRMRLFNDPLFGAPGIWFDGTSLIGRSFIGTYDDNKFGIYGAGSGWGFIYDVTNGNVGVGVSSPQAKLDVSGTIKISGGTPAVGKVLTSDASGLASWKNLPPKGTATLVRTAQYSADEYLQYISTDPVYSRAILFQHEIFDEASAFVDSVYTCPETGMYHFDINMSANIIHNNPTYDASRKLSLFRNNVEEEFSTFYIPPANANLAFSATLSNLIKLNAGDQLKMKILDQTGSSANPTIYYDWGSFAIYKVY